MVIKETKVTLESGREITLKPITFDHRNELKDLAGKYYRDSGNVASFFLFGKAVRFGTTLTEAELIELTDVEILEAGGKVFEGMNTSESDKKKL